MECCVFIGNIIHCNKPFTVQTLEKGFIVVRDGKILAIDNVSALDDYKEKLGLKVIEEVILEDNQLLLPGLIDTHFHAPQYPNAGLGYDKTLLDWLSTYTFSLEKKYKDIEFARKVYEAVVKKTLASGTTTACYFATLHLESSLDLVDIALRLGQRAFVGKVNMTTLAPPDYVETSEETLTNTVSFVESVLAKKSKLVKPIITPRFALSLSMDEMRKLGEIARKYELNIQSHISENVSELDLVKQTFPGKTYAEVYDEAKLLTDKTVLAHGIHLTDSEAHLIATRGTSIAHCPDSNICLQSGACDVKRLIHFGVNVSLGTDISGGCSPSILTTMRSALSTSAYISFGKENYDALNCYDVFYLATIGGAKALGLEDVVGNFAVGKDFDAIIAEIPSEELFHPLSPLELFEKFIFTGDDRNIKEVYVCGRRVK